MLMKPEIQGKQKVFDFMAAVDAEREKERQHSAFRNSETYKRNLVDRECERGKEECLRYVVQNCYRNAMPLSDEYKNSICTDLSSDLDTHCPKGLLYYFREAIKKGQCGDRCRRMVEAVCKEVDSSYSDKKLAPAKYDEKDLVFRMDPDMQQRVDYISQNLSLDDVSDLIRQSVKSTTISEVRRAKDEREQSEALQRDLANDLSIQNEAAIDAELQRRGYADRKFFQPTLFQGMVMGKMQDPVVAMESYTYHALEDIGMPGEESSPEYNAFVEAVKDYTWFTLESAFFRKRPFDVRYEQNLAREYAQKK